MLVKKDDEKNRQTIAVQQNVKWCCFDGRTEVPAWRTHSKQTEESVSAAGAAAQCKLILCIKDVLS